MDDNRILDNYIATIGESRRIMGNMLSILSHQETALQNIITTNTIASQRVRNIPPVVPIQPVWQSRFGRHTTGNVLPSRPNPIIDSSLNPTENLLFADVPENDRYESCPITYEDFINESEITRIRQCGHYFSREAIERWLTTSNHCPICRCTIRDEPITNVSRETMIDSMIRILTRDLVSDTRPGIDNALIFHIDIADNSNDPL